MAKLIAKVLLCILLLSLCLNLVGCIEIEIRPVWKERNWKFKAIIIDVSGNNTLNFELSKIYDLRIAIFDQEINDETYKDIQIEYNEENLVVNYDISSKDRIYFSIYAYELGEDNELKITYKDKTIKVNYNVVDYNFDKNGYVTPTSIQDLDKYPEFKEMLLSIKYHEFNEPYIGLNNWEYDVQYDGKIYFHYNRNDYKSKYMSLVYLQYLTDSVYYPTRFIGFHMYMFLPEDTDVSKGAGKTVMKSFGLSLPVEDPHHHKRADGITGMYFDAYNMDEYRYIYEGEEWLHPVILRLERYPEKFFKYQFGELTIYILSTKDSGATAYFTHGSYFYNISASYDFD